MKIHVPLKSFVEKLILEFDRISEKRKAELEELAGYIFRKQKAAQPVRIIVICTHNSMRSQIGQLWLQLAASWYAIKGLETYSGGTEATAFNPRAVAALRRAGFLLEPMTGGENPVYQTTISFDGRRPLSLFSKTFDAPPNPKKGFAALMVCSEADAACPPVPGAEARFSIPYEDPKNYDGTADETLQYDALVRQMGRELFYAIWYIHRLNNRTK